MVYAATTQTWHDFYNLGRSRELDAGVITLLASLYPGRVVYRPRPTYAIKHPELCLPIGGATLSRHRALVDELRHAELLVTLGSNAAVEALALGVPTIVLGDNPCRVMNGAPNNWVEARERLFNALSMCQWRLDEYASGVGWNHIQALLQKAS